MVYRLLWRSVTESMVELGPRKKSEEYPHTLTASQLHGKVVVYSFQPADSSETWCTCVFRHRSNFLSKTTELISGYNMIVSWIGRLLRGQAIPEITPCITGGAKQPINSGVNFRLSEVGFRDAGLGAPVCMPCFFWQTVLGDSFSCRYLKYICHGILPKRLSGASF